MRKLILKMSVSTDGFVGGPHGEIDWIFKSLDDDTTAWSVGLLRQAGLHIMGSRTFYDMASWWPYSTEPFAPPMNEIPKAVFTRKGHIASFGEGPTSRAVEDAARMAEEKGYRKADTLPSAARSWQEAYVAGGDIAMEIKRLKQQNGQFIVAHGGAGFAQSLVATGLIDEYVLLVHPVALGKGLPLFSSLVAPLDLKLVSSRAFPSGAVAQVYRPV